jgi:LmbE family N-acetylglucosaminyl deacetylase
VNNILNAARSARILGVFAHPDDESFCAGGAFAGYSASGAEVMVVSATRGEAGQIRSAGVATRLNLGQVREQELSLACERLGVQHAVCLDYSDGKLQQVDQNILTGEIAEIIRRFRPEVVITFGPDGGYGHPDHIAISAATTAACMRSGDGRLFPEQLIKGLAPHQPAHLLYSYFPQQRQLLLKQIAHWLVQTDARFQGTPEFAYGILLLCEEATLLHYTSDHVDVNWYPAGFSIVEQGERDTGLYLLLSGTVQVVREGNDGTRQVLAHLQPGAFFGEEGIAYRQARSTHVIAEQNVTCLVLSPDAPTDFVGRGAEAHLSGSAFSEEWEVDQTPEDTIRIEVGPYLRHKLAAIAAHCSQFPIQLDLLPLSILQALMGHEYFVPVTLVSDGGRDFLALQGAL